MEPLGPAKIYLHLFNLARPGLGVHGGANGLVPSLPASLC